MPLASFQTEGSSNFHEDLIAGGTIPLLVKKRTMLSGQNLARGAVLGIVTASGKYRLSLSGASDGSQVIRGVLMEACDATSADKDCLVAVSGQFIGTALTLGSGWTLPTAELAAEVNNIHID